MTRTTHQSGPRRAGAVEVSITGQAHAVTALVRSLATVAAITSIRHHVRPGDVRLDATCQPRPAAVRR